MVNFLQLVVLGLLAGGVYVAVGVGFGLVWGVLNIVNLAHGALVMVGGYLTWKLFSSLGLDPFLSLPLDAGLLFIFGYLLQRGVINRVIRAPLLFTFLLTFGVNLIVINLLLLLFKSDFRSVTPPYSGAGLELGTLVIPYTRLGALVVAVLLAVGLAFILNRTRTGLAIQAVGADRDAAQLVGIDLRHTYALTFAVGAACAGVAGGLITLNTPNDGGWLRRLMGRHWFHCKPPEHLYYFSPRTLRALLERHGFHRVETRLSGKYVTVRYLCDRTKAYGVGLARTLTGTIGRLPGADAPFPLPVGEFVTFAERP